MKKETKKTEKEEKAYREKLEILEKAKESKGKQLAIGFEDGELVELDELKKLLSKQVEDPQEKHTLYYNGIRKVLMKYLPIDKNIRRIIYDEKDIFLNRGKAKDKRGIRGSDGRMTYNEDMTRMVELVAEWVMTSQDPVDLYKAIYELNESLGFGHQSYDDTSPGFHREMQKIIKSTKPKNNP